MVSHHELTAEGHYIMHEVTYTIQNRIQNKQHVSWRVEDETPKHSNALNPMFFKVLKSESYSTQDSQLLQTGTFKEKLFLLFPKNRDSGGAGTPATSGHMNLRNTTTTFS